MIDKGIWKEKEYNIGWDEEEMDRFTSWFCIHPIFCNRSFQIGSTGLEEPPLEPLAPILEEPLRLWPEVEILGVKELKHRGTFFTLIVWFCLGIKKVLEEGPISTIYTNTLGIKTSNYFVAASKPKYWVTPKLEL